MNKFTIFTPSYNRGHLLNNIYNFLIKENYKYLEWIIVDDGSTDDTKKIVEELINREEICIKYIYQNNLGKHVAYNKAIDNAESDLFICIDSDDIYEKNSLIEINEFWTNLNQKDKYCGLGYLSKYTNGKIIGSKFPKDEMDSDLVSIYFYEHVKGDKGLMFRTDVLKEYRFPIFKDEKFMPESVLYGYISERYKMKFINKVYEIKEYRDDGLTKKYRKLTRKNPNGVFLSYSILLRFKMKGLIKVKAYIQYIRFMFLLNKKWIKCFKEIRNKYLFVLLTPIGWILSKQN